MSIKLFFNKPLFSLCIGILLQACVFYSFSGSSLSSEVKTFSIKEFYSDVAKGPPTLAQDFSHQLGEQLLQKAPLNQVDKDGDIQFEGTIKGFSYTPVAPTTGQGGFDNAAVTRLTITVEVDYINLHDKEFQFTKKRFSQYADMPADASIDAKIPELVEEIFKKLIEDILNASVTNW